MNFPYKPSNLIKLNLLNIYFTTKSRASYNILEVIIKCIIRILFFFLCVSQWVICVFIEINQQNKPCKLKKKKKITTKKKGFREHVESNDSNQWIICVSGLLNWNVQTNLAT